MKPILVMTRQTGGGGGLAAVLNPTALIALGNNTSGFPATATFELNTDGVAYKTETDGAGGSSRVSVFTWKTGSGLTSDYEAIVSTVSGVAGTGTIGSSVNLGTTRTWVKNRAPVGTAEWDIGVIIRPAGGGSNLAGSTTMTLNVNVS